MMPALGCVDSKQCKRAERASLLAWWCTQRKAHGPSSIADNTREVTKGMQGAQAQGHTPGARAQWHMSGAQADDTVLQMQH